MTETSNDTQAERFSLRRTRLALSALRAVLTEMADRFESEDRELCERALVRLGNLSSEIEGLAPAAPERRSGPSLTCTAGEVCQAARQSLPSELRDRVLVSADQADQTLWIDDASLISGLRDLAATMFERGANAVLLNAHLEDSEAVFALIDDRQGPAPQRPDGSPVPELELRGIAGERATVTPIGSAQDPQGVIVRVPVTLSAPAAAASAEMEAGA